MSGSVTISVDEIIFRKGLELDLPGVPTSGNPDVPTPGLNIGEPGFTTDSGRLFIGSDPNQGGLWYNRATFPYTNIEVLTENSSDFLGSFIDGRIQSLETAYIATMPMDICSLQNTNDWRNVQIPLSLGNFISFRVNDGSNIGSAQITYFVFGSNSAPIRTGKMQICFAGNANAPLLIDSGTAYPRSDLQGNSARDPNQVYGSLQFQIVQVTDVSGTYLALQYRNLLNDTPTMAFRIERAQVPTANGIGTSPSITINVIGTQGAGQAFTVTGSLTNYQVPPSLFYLDSAEGSSYTPLPNGSVTPTQFSFLHPAIENAETGATITIRDLSGITVISNSFNVNSD